MSIPPVLLITFNRPRLTRQVLAALRLVRPPRLFVANDGPRPTRPNDAALCAEIRTVVMSEIDWPCEVKTLFQTANLGCRRGVQAAISWFFSEVGEGIILEDDIVPHPSFFAYQTELLNRYRDDERIMVIAGHQAFAGNPWSESYRFSRYAAIWGWGTWKRVWDAYEPLAESYFKSGEPEKLKSQLRHPELVDWWDGSIKGVAEGRIDTWDVQLCYHLMRHQALCVVPKVRLVQNIGFGQDATHTVGEGHEEAAGEVVFPLVHPQSAVPDRWYDSRYERKNYWNRHVRLSWRILERIRKLVRKLRT